MAKIHVTGQQQVLANLAKKRKDLANACARGLKKAGLLLQRESQRIVPVEFGVLKNSAYTRSSGAGFFTVVNVGYTANYALYVHEQVQEKLRGLPRPSGKGMFWDPANRGQSKFLEKPMRWNKDAMKKILRDEMKI